LLSFAVPRKRLFRAPTHGHVFMIETNPILAQIADLTDRVESLRGYL
jgi:hypothetical protein